MKRMRITISLVAVFLVLTVHAAENDVTFLQLFYLLKQVFPDVGQVDVLLIQDDVEKELPRIKRAAKLYHLKPTLYQVANSWDIGKAMQKMAPGAFLIIKDSQLFLKKINKMYIFSKCKEKKISIITSSKEYLDSGALLGVVKKEGKNKIIANLRQSDTYRSRFTDELIKKVGIQEVIL